MDRCTCSKAGSADRTNGATLTQPNDSALATTIDLHPYVGETPPKASRSWLTPVPLFYIRNRFSEPEIDLTRWSLSVEGAVSPPLRLTSGQIE